MPTGRIDSDMTTDRRTFLGGVAVSAVAAVAGCAQDDDDDIRPPQEGDGPENGDGNGEVETRETAVVREVDALKPRQVDWEDRENEDGNLTLVVTLNNIHPSPVRGTMKATFATTDGEEVYTEQFTLSEDGQEVTMDVPVSYDRYSSNMSLPDFSFENVTEQ